MVKVKKFWIEKYKYEISIIREHKKLKKAFKLKDLVIAVKMEEKCRADSLLKTPGQIGTI